ncbi:hypothetical protein [Pseudomonas oryzihabitans]|uniref:hypothetical protein n=1 Tax=Pseudomonas oryzihabitans TaxID=47885 RepID=UPI0021B6DC63|nr:hypothetical protein [Pseudomonas oryzihabitans]
MKMKDGATDGVLECEEAFDRLVRGSPRIAAHVGMPPQKITAGVVSVEAGFDRGYLKSGRLKHQPLIAKIRAFRESGGVDGASLEIGKIKSQLHSSSIKVSRLQQELEIAICQRQAVVAQNIQLHERVRLLELKIHELQPGLRLLGESC